MPRDGAYPRASREAGRYSRFVRLARIFLPLLALMLLSALVLFARRINPEDAIPYADVDVRELARQGGISGPAFSSRAAGGATLEVTASRATPDSLSGGGVSVAGIMGRVDWPDGESLTIEADIGRIDGDAGILELENNAVLATSLGYEIRSEFLIARTDIVEVGSPGGVEAEGPLGEVEAGAMRLLQTGGSGGNYVVDFTDGVKLLYDPVR